MTIIDRKAPIHDPRDDHRESVQQLQAVQGDIAAAEPFAASASSNSPRPLGRRSPSSSSQRSQAPARTAAREEEDAYILAHDTVAATSTSAHSHDAGPIGALPPSYASIVRRHEEQDPSGSRDRRDRRRSRRRHDSDSTHSDSEDGRRADVEGGEDGDEDEEPTERTWLFFSRPQQRRRSRRRGQARRPRDGSKTDARERARALCLNLARLVLLCLILAVTISEVASLFFPDRRVAPPAPYALPAHLHGEVLEVLSLGSPRAAKDAGDTRVPPGTLFVRKEVVLDGQNLQLQRDKLLSLLKYPNSTKPEVQAFLFHTTGMRFTGTIDIARAHSSWPEYQASLNKTQASFNITAFSNSHNALESALTLARVATRDGQQGLTLASDQQPWSDPAQSGVTVLVDIGLPILTGESDDWRIEVIKPTLMDLDVSTETMAITVHDSNFATDDQPADRINRYRSLKLFSTVGSVDTGVISAAGNLSIETLHSPITGVGVYRILNGSVSIRSISGNVNLGVVNSPTADFRLETGKLKVQLLEAENLTVETDSAGVEGTLLPYGTVLINTNTGSVDCRISLAATRETDNLANVRVTSNLGSILLRYQQQPSHIPLRSFVSSRVGTVDVTLADSFQGDWLVSSQVEGLEEISRRPGKEAKVDRGNAEGNSFSLQGRVWLPGHDAYGRGEPGWSYSEATTYVAPIRLTL